MSTTFAVLSLSTWVLLAFSNKSCGPGTVLVERTGLCTSIAIADAEARAALAHGPKITQTDGVLTLSVASEKDISFKVGENSVSLSEFTLDQQLSETTVALKEQLKIQLGEFKSDLDGLDDRFETEATATTQKITAMQKSLETTVNDNLNSLGRNLSQVLSQVETLENSFGDSHFACANGWGGKTCAEDVGPPIVGGCNSFNEKLYLFLPPQGATATISATRFPRPTFENIGKIDGMKVELGLITADNRFVTISSWNQTKVSNSFTAKFDFKSAKVLKNDDIQLKLGVFQFEYRATDAHGNTGTCDVEVQVGDVDECKAGTDNCHGKYSICKNLAYKVGKGANGTFQCSCLPGFEGDGYTNCAPPKCIKSPTFCSVYKGTGVESGRYPVCSSQETAYCDNEIDGGGWTLVANVAPTDGNSVGYQNSFWTTDGPYGTDSKCFSNDYKSRQHKHAKGTELMTASAHLGQTGKVRGWRKWEFKARTWDSMFSTGIVRVHGVDKCETGKTTGKSIGTVDKADDIIRYGDNGASGCVYTDVNPSNSGQGDTIRFTVFAYNNRDNKMAGFASCIDCGTPWQGSNDRYQGMDHAACDRSGGCHYRQITQMTENGRLTDCRGGYCGGTYYRAKQTAAWNSRFFIR